MSCHWGDAIRQRRRNCLTGWCGGSGAQSIAFYLERLHLLMRLH